MGEPVEPASEDGRVEGTYPTQPKVGTTPFSSTLIAEHPALSLFPIHPLLPPSLPFLFVQSTILSLSFLFLGVDFSSSSVYASCSSSLISVFSLLQRCHRTSSARLRTTRPHSIAFNLSVTDHDEFCENTTCPILTSTRPLLSSTIYTLLLIDL